jgi:hypothetical protein
MDPKANPGPSVDVTIDVRACGSTGRRLLNHARLMRRAYLALRENPNLLTWRESEEIEELNSTIIRLVDGSQTLQNVLLQEQPIHTDDFTCVDNGNKLLLSLMALETLILKIESRRTTL